MAVLYITATVAHGARARRYVAALGATRRRSRAHGYRPLCTWGNVVLPWRVPCGPPTSGGRPRTLHFRPVRGSSVPHGPRSGCFLPNLCRTDPLVTGVPGASPLPRPRCRGVGT